MIIFAYHNVINGISNKPFISGTKTSGSGNTTNMIKHCRTYHGPEYSAAELQAKEEKARQAQSQQVKMTSVFSMLSKETPPSGKF